MIPMSAIVFSWSQIQNSSPLVPLVNFFGALFVEDLNLVLPKPPLPPIAATNSSFSFLKSYINVLLSLWLSMSMILITIKNKIMNINTNEKNWSIKKRNRKYFKWK